MASCVSFQKFFSAICVVSFSFLLENTILSIDAKEDGESKLFVAIGKENLVIFTVATEETDGYKRFMRSVEKNGLSEYLQVLGLGVEWQGGDMNNIGGGQKVRLLKDGLEKYKDEKDLVIMFVDSYDVLFTAGIMKKFHKMEARVVFSAEHYLWPDKSLGSKYPKIEKGLPYLNSGMFMGYAEEIWKIVSHEDIKNSGDDQLYYTKIFLDPQLREELNMKLDNLAVLFQNLHGEEDYPSVMLAIFIEYPTPFITEFFQKIANLSYPKNKIDIFIHNSAAFHELDVSDFLDDYSEVYSSVRELPPSYSLSEYEARNRGLKYFLGLKCQYYFTVDSVSHIDNPNTLKLLIEQNRGIIDNLFITLRGYHQQQLVYLTSGGVFMYVSNMVEYGHLVNPETFSDYLEQKHPDMYQMFDNPEDWEERYVHHDWSKQLMPNANISMPCPDVYSYPLMSETFAQHLIEEMEYYGQWSGGGNQDSRLAGGYENVPTRDIHMNQINFEQHWLHFIKEHVCPIQERVYPGYYSKANAIMNFVVRYKPDEQASLRPHHDSSTFTINVALNKRGVDYEGGGARFIRYNCSAIGMDVGHTLMHPGRLTHFHEGLPTTRGTRYIMVSFIDP
uniref:Procollagen-lysine,2-oxoglutarate 5-dioxygenase 1-like n=1 Tax=Saccoglossus kowalevskii TaxID=10224 RepID=A0ABM0LVT7_SACKO|nr:PREDICTED: procollagen-lysine,2-oxoglutarate 5-dioxygenase 1-like [Saccoglossus kowalevskii]